MTRDDLGPHDRILNTETEWVGPDDTFTAEEQEEQCCATVSTDECADDGKVEDYNEAPVDDLDLEEIKRQAEIRFGVDIERVRIEDVGPKGPCGKKYTEWEQTLNCCDDVVELGWDEEESADVVAPGSFADILVTGGRAPYRWKIRGYGFYGDEDRTLRDVVTDGPELRIYTTDDVCGYCPIEVGDGCSTLEGGLRSTTGIWQEVGSFEESATILAAIPEMYNCTTNTYVFGTEVIVEQYNGQYALGDDHRGPDYVPDDRVYGLGMGSKCCSYDIGPTTYKDPVVGVFDVPATSGTNHEVATWWRVAWYYSTVGAYFYVHKWVCP